jgi:hypothetical protein
MLVKVSVLSLGSDNSRPAVAYLKLTLMFPGGTLFSPNLNAAGERCVKICSELAMTFLKLGSRTKSEYSYVWKNKLPE